MGLMFQGWFCRTCGFEVCQLCYLELPTENPNPHSTSGPHSQSWLIPVSSFLPDDLKLSLKEMRMLTPMMEKTWVLEDPALESVRAQGGSPTRSVRRFKPGELDPATFDKLWNAREPFVMTGVVEPHTLSSLFDLDDEAQHKCTVAYHDGESWVEDSGDHSTLETYFAAWDKQKKYPLQVRVSGILILPDYLFKLHMFRIIRQKTALNQFIPG